MEIKKLEKLIVKGESQVLEFKESTGEREEICKTICAFANSNGGIILVGLKNNGKLSKSQITEKSQTNITNLFANFKPRISSFISFEMVHGFQKQNILIIKVKKPETFKTFYRNSCLKRVGASNKDITEEIIKKVTNKNYDWSSEICKNATIDDLDSEAILKIKKIWAEKTGKQNILKFNTRRLLIDLFGTNEILNATLILLGKNQALEKYNINTEITFHYRNDPKSIRSDDRKDFRSCFALEYDEIWNKIDARNEIFYFEKGLFVDQIKKFNESVIREALLNCITHRDYETEYASSQITIEQSSEKIEFKNPGQLPTTIDLEKLIKIPSRPKNRKLAEVFQKLRLIEKSGFGIDLIVQKTISEGKGSPKYISFDNHYVFLEINATLQNKEFVKYLYRISQKENYQFDALEVLTLQEILETGSTRQENIKKNLSKQGFVESSGTGKGSKWILSKKYYELSGDDVNKYLDQKYDKFEHKEKVYRFLKEFKEATPKDINKKVVKSVSIRTIQRYLDELVKAKRVIRLKKKKDRSYLYKVNT